MGLPPESLESSHCCRTQLEGAPGRDGLQGLPEVELLEPREAAGLGMFVSRTASPQQNRAGLGVSSPPHQEEFAGKFFPCWFYLFSLGQKCTESLG